MDEKSDPYLLLTLDGCPLYRYRVHCELSIALLDTTPILPRVHSILQAGGQNAVTSTDEDSAS